MPSNHLILCHPLLLLSSIFPNIRVFSSESALCIRWPEDCQFSFSNSPSNEYSRLISFRTDWFDLLAVQGSLKQEYWGGLQSPLTGTIPSPGMKPRSPAFQEDSLPSEPPRKPSMNKTGPLNIQFSKKKKCTIYTVTEKTIKKPDTLTMLTLLTC